jgi:Co/Zn/Cd efflux system component
LLNPKVLLGGEKNMQSAKSLGVATLLTALHLIVKLTGGYLTNSLALISDACHLLTDLLSLVISWWAMKKSIQPPTDWSAYGFHRVGILAALINNISLVAISFYILYQAYDRFIHPETTLLFLRQNPYYNKLKLGWLISFNLPMSIFNLNYTNVRT